MKERITITIPPALIEEADRKARELDRSRSWLVSLALESYLRGRGPEGEREAVREATTAYQPGLGPQRRAQLEADLALSPEERVRLAEETLRVTGKLRRRAPERDRVITFSSLEDFLDWEEHRALDP